MSGMLLSKTFGQQANSIATFRGINKNLAALQIRQAMVGRWFFMIIGTIFSIMPAFVYWLAGTLADQRRPDAPTDRRHRRVHDAPEPAVLPARPAAQRPGRDPGLARPVRPDLRVPRDGPRDRRRARRGRARPRRRSGARSASMTCRSATRPRRSRRRVRTMPWRAATIISSPRKRPRRWPPPRSTRARSRPWSGDLDGGAEIAAPAIELVPTFGLEDIDFEARAGRARRARRPVRFGQDDDDLPDPAAVRRRRRRGRDR